MHVIISNSAISSFKKKTRKFKDVRTALFSILGGPHWQKWVEMVNTLIFKGKVYIGQLWLNQLCGNAFLYLSVQTMPLIRYRQIVDRLVPNYHLLVLEPRLHLSPTIHRNKMVLMREGWRIPLPQILVNE